MSADNWAVCPRCLKRAEAERDKLERKVQDAYGKLPKDEYLALVKKAEQPQKPLDHTLREDYEQGTDEDGEYSVNYTCSCSKCGYAAQYKYSAVLVEP